MHLYIGTRMGEGTVESHVFLKYICHEAKITGLKCLFGHLS